MANDLFILSSRNVFINAINDVIAKKKIYPPTTESVISVARVAADIERTSGACDAVDFIVSKFNEWKGLQNANV